MEKNGTKLNRNDIMIIIYNRNKWATDVILIPMLCDRAQGTLMQ